VKRKKISCRVWSLFFVLVMLLGMIPVISVSAEDDASEVMDYEYINGTTADGFDYYVYEGDMTISGYSGTAKKVIIPETIEGQKVTSVGSSAFYDNTTVEEVIIPDGVENIDFSAFENCTSLKKITIPNSVKYIYDWAFSGCISLVDVKIPDSVEYVGAHVLEDTSFFNNAKNWTDGVLYSGVALIDTDGEVLVGEYAIKEGTEIIVDYAFGGCYNLECLIVPSSVKTIGRNVVGNCDSLTKIVVDENNSIFDSRNNCNAVINTAKNELVVGCAGTVIPDSVVSIGEDAFASCTSIKSIVIPDSVTSIGNAAFAYCFALESVNIPDSVIHIGDSAFHDTALYNNHIDEDVFYIDSVAAGVYYGYVGSECVIESGTRLISDYAFSYYENLKSVTIPASVTIIGEGAFEGCSELTDVYFEGTQQQWESISIGDYNEMLTDVKIHFNSGSEKPTEEVTKKENPKDTITFSSKTKDSEKDDDGMLFIIIGCACGALVIGAVIITVIIMKKKNKKTQKVAQAYQQPYVQPTPQQTYVQPADQVSMSEQE